jgi:hypothetical protein
MFPNAISLRTVDRDYDHFPLFNVVFVVLLAIGVFIVVRKIRKLLGGRRSPEKTGSGEGK